MILRSISIGLMCWLVASPAIAQAPQTSLRPQARVDVADVPVVTRSIIRPDFALILPGRSLRPKARPAALTRPQTDSAPRASASQEAAFRRWIAGFRPKALAQGISAKTYDRAFAGARFQPQVIKRDGNQAEFARAIWDYLDSAASSSRISTGKEKLRKHRQTMDRIEAHYGVEKEVFTAVWGMESAYGSFRGKTPIVSALATLAYDGRRGAFFEEQLIGALRILQNGDTTPERMTGSWAGAMGHTQFIPTSYLAYAVDFTGDGRRDIWSDDPTDALASTAAYLKRHGWTKGQPWAVEVALPRGFDFAQADKSIKKMPSDWARLGVRDLNGRTVRDYGSAYVFLPAGARGPAFLAFNNFKVISRYNAADAYVMGVGHLSDRLRGRPEIQGKWPRDDKALTRSQKKELQQRLTARGYNTGGVDGRIGRQSRAAIRAYQKSAGLTPDGFASMRVLKTLR